MIPAPHHTRTNLPGIIWMVVAMAAFSVEDVLVKSATLYWPLGQVLVAFGAGGTLVFAGLVHRKASPRVAWMLWTRVMGWRAVFELVGRLSYGLAIALTPLSSATALLQATPIVVVMGASLFFREKVSWSRWGTILVGLLGVLVILRPSTNEFSTLSLLAVLATVGFAGRDLASRAVPSTMPTSVLGLSGFLTVIAAGAMYSLWERHPWMPPVGKPCMLVLAAVISGAFAYAALMKAMRTGSISVVTPFRYTRLVFGLGLGVAIFGERLDGLMILGSGIVIGSGLAVWWQGCNSSPRRT